MSDAETQRRAAEARSFTTVVATLEDGELVDELTDKIRRIVETLSDHRHAFGGKPKASLTLTLDFVHDEIIEVTAVVKQKLPAAPRRRTVFWATADNHLSKSNPRQIDLPLRDVSRPAGDVRDVS